MAMLSRLAIAALVVLALPARAEEGRPIVVELFTSQGCNSCPPADAFLGKLSHRPGFLTFAFHVDYWNYIGWIDPFGRPWATARQRSYQMSLDQPYVYTPQMVVDGEAQGIGSEPNTIDALIRTAQSEPWPPHPDLVLRWRADGALLVDVGGGTSPPKSPADIWLIGYDAPHETQVLRGENAGETATDYDAVRSYRRLGAWPGWSLELVVPASEVATLGTGGIAVLVQAGGLGPILNAAEIAPR